LSLNLQAQLELLRKRIAKVDAKFAAASDSSQPSATAPALAREAEDLPARLFREYPMDHVHGHVLVERLRALEGKRWVFLDTETTGLAGGSGTLAFLIGAASVEPDGFHLHQWFLREPGEEAEALASLAEYLEGFDTLVTYNGKSFDQPLLETRYTMNRMKPPFSRLEHLDLLYGSRRLWKLRFESCRLVELEKQILGHERVGDVPGSLIPQLYFDYLRTRDGGRLKPVLEHNALDILSLAFLAVIVPASMEDPANAPLAHGAELLGLARWLAKEERMDEAVALYRRAVDAVISDELLFRALWELAQLERRRDQVVEALTIWSDLSSSRNPYRAEAYEELAKYYEHREKNLFMALECTLAAVQIENTAEREHRRQRLERKIATSKTRRLL
jgi:uncharacterized protein